jgi:hypothetical protein
LKRASIEGEVANRRVTSRLDVALDRKINIDARRMQEFFAARQNAVTQLQHSIHVGVAFAE